MPISFARYDYFLLVAVSYFTETSASMLDILVLVSRLTLFFKGSFAVISFESVTSSYDIPLGVFNASVGEMTDLTIDLYLL